MKHLHRHIIPFILLALLFVAEGCVFDKFDDEPDADGFGTVGYMAVRLMPSDGAGSRASVGDEFFVGSSSEFSLSNEANHFAIFYNDEQETPIAISELAGMSSDQTIDDTANSSLVYATIAARNELKEELERLKECYVILNTSLTRDQLLKLTRNELIKLVVDSPFFTAKNGSKYFTMSNSVYVENGQKKIFTAVDPDKIYSSYQETIEQAWKGNAAVNAYVERLSAKFVVRFENNNFNNDNADRVFIPEKNHMVLFSHVNEGDVPFYEDRHPGSNVPYSYRIRITGWGLNALEKEVNLFRNFDASTKYFDNWFNTSLKRSYWSVDPNYSRASYPWQYRKVIDNSGLHVYETGTNNLLVNYSYVDLNRNMFSGQHQYAPENTYDYTDKTFSAALNNKPEFLAGTHIIVCGEVLTNIVNPNVWEPHEIYRDRNGSFYRDERSCVKALVASMNNTLKSHASLKFTYWDWSVGGVEYKLFGRTKGEYALYYNGRKLDDKYVDELYDRGVSLTAEAEFKGSDGKRIMWIDGLTIRDDRGNVMQTYSNIDEVNPSNDEYLRSSSVNDTKSVIFEHVGAVDHFSDGKTYYAIPIGYVKDEARSEEDPNGSDIYSIYGVVRNSTYDILIKGVSGIGAAVDIPAQPIIPNTISTSDHLYIGFDILEWHPIDQNVPGLIN